MSSNNRLVTVEDDDDFDVDNMDFDLPTDAGPSSTPYSASQPLSAQQQTLLSQFTGASGSSSHPAGSTRVIPTSEVGRFKHYIQLYPIYLDARRPHKNGERRVSKAKSVPYPKAQEIAEVCGRFLGIEPVLEPEKTHPKDWENPGRVRVLLKHKESGRLVNPDIPDSEFPPQNCIEQR
jgi:signal recognition particle subunit SRP19